MSNEELIIALVNQTDHSIDEFTGGAIIQTIINNNTIIKYRVSLYFGYQNKKPLSRTIEIDRDVFFALPEALDDYLNNTVKRSDSKVFTMSKTTGRPTSRPTGISTPTNTNTNTIVTNTNTTITKTKVKKEHFEMFDTFRLSYKGKKRGNDTEFKNFMKHKDWVEVLPKLVDIKIDYDVSDIKFIPHLSTFINQRRWELIDDSKQKPSSPYPYKEFGA